jgi:hypothetical protein
MLSRCCEFVDSRGGRICIERLLVNWVRFPKQRIVVLPVREDRGRPIAVPKSAPEQRRGASLTLETHSRLFNFTTPDGKTKRVCALTPRWTAVDAHGNWGARGTVGRAPPLLRHVVVVTLLVDAMDGTFRSYDPQTAIGFVPGCAAAESGGPARIVPNPDVRCRMRAPRKKGTENQS